MANSPYSTPKRKLAELLTEHTSNFDTSPHFTFDPQSTIEDGSASPRSCVAHRFRGLTLNSGGGASGNGGGRTSRSPEPDHSRIVFVSAPDETQNVVRKRAKLQEVEVRGAESAHLQLSGASQSGAPPQPAEIPTKDMSGYQGPQQQPPRLVRFAVSTEAVEEDSGVFAEGGLKLSTAESTTEIAMSTSPPPASRDSLDGTKKSRYRARAGTPPRALKGDISLGKEPGDTVITDPVRASLTWHDDEITIYDPDDSEDDGTGINGIGFKPTPAIAYARTVRRKQQLAEYRKREEREARAKRNHRRRGSPVPGLVELKGTVERRRVRFMESATELISF